MWGLLINVFYVQDLPGTYNGYIYILKGSGTFGEDKAEAKQGQAMKLSGADEDNKSGIEITAGEPIKASVVAHGPFVMNTEDEIIQAYRDYQEGKFTDLED